MRSGELLLIFGASARAAAFSALRAGLRPWCADLFADRDLLARCPVQRIARYPGEYVQVEQTAPAGPWMYTGRLENRPDLIERISARRPLWGSDAGAVRKARSPRFVASLLRGAGLPCPRLRENRNEPPSACRWLVKPRAGCGAIRFVDRKTSLVPPKRSYLQEYVDGEACSATYLGDGQSARLLGVTRQLVGEAWLHAAPFQYCGSVGPLAVGRQVRAALEHLGNVLASGCGLRGLFGVDFVLRDDVPWPVEVNPRYTASVEVLEYACGLQALALHRRVFETDAPLLMEAANSSSNIVGKAILFARAPQVFPGAGPWDAVPARPWGLAEVPAFADIPAAGETFEAGSPVLTCFARADSPADCLAQLQRTAADLDRILFGA